jgi:hypothetical protein
MECSVFIHVYFRSAVFVETGGVPSENEEGNRSISVVCLIDYQTLGVAMVTMMT